jgi:hypothetical protein
MIEEEEKIGARPEISETYRRRLIRHPDIWFTPFRLIAYTCLYYISP